MIEAAVALTAGAQASSTALIGFGLDSVIEVSSAAAVAWQFSSPTTRPGESRPADHRAVVLRPGRLRHRGVVRALFGYAEPRPSIVRGSCWRGQPGGDAVVVQGPAPHRTRTRIPSAVADSKQTLLCTYLSAVLLVGLGSTACSGWSWADPIASLVIAAVAIRYDLRRGRPELLRSDANDRIVLRVSPLLRLIARPCRPWPVMVMASTANAATGDPRSGQPHHVPEHSPVSQAAMRWSCFRAEGFAMSPSSARGRARHPRLPARRNECYRIRLRRRRARRTPQSRRRSSVEDRLTTIVSDAREPLPCRTPARTPSTATCCSTWP